jgi:DNA mismatch endonuclease (patch repair protein)
MTLSRSEQMARIRSAHTQPEVLLRTALWGEGLRYRVHAKTPVGRPDIVFPGSNVAIFIDGCFWHGCPEHYTRPRSREAFWAAKLTENTARDRLQTLTLDAAGWRAVRVWEHEVFTAFDDVVRDVWRAIEDATWVPPPREIVVRVDVLDPATRLERHHLEDLRGRNPARTVEHVRRTTKWARRSP